MSNYRELEIWKEGCLFAKDVYKVNRGIRDAGLTNQMARAAVSISSNIAEGSERGSDREFARFLKIAKSSCEECRTQLYIAFLVEYISKDIFAALDTQAESIGKRIGALINYLSRSQKK